VALDTGWVGAKLFAVSDIHVGNQLNRPVVQGMRPDSEEDWLIVAGDVAERVDDIRWALKLLASRFARVIWTPGNHELWSTSPTSGRGEQRYRLLVDLCRELGVLTPEDPYPLWQGEGEQALVVPMFLLYDYTFRPPRTANKAEALALAQQRNATAADEAMLSFEPYSSREQWCLQRVEATRRRLDVLDPEIPLVLVNHWPLRRELTRLLYPPEFALWCGTELTADWHRRYPVVCSVYGHLHIRRTDYCDGVRFEEVSLGYPREWQSHGLPDPVLRQILPAPSGPPNPLVRLGLRALEQAFVTARGIVHERRYPGNTVER
jgi:3',5'-cyclic AMP phosphodiesterase CpdA